MTGAMYSIPPEINPNFFVQKGLRFFAVPSSPSATAGFPNGLSRIKR